MFRLVSPFDPLAFHEVLDRAGYTADGIKALKKGVKSSSAVDRAMLDLRTSTSDPLHTLARLFFLGSAVAADALRAAVAPLSLEDLVAAGLVRECAEGFRGNVLIERHGELVVCSDFIVSDEPLPGDHVLGVAPSAISLAALAPQRSVESVLDVGTGGGIQALLASRYAERVVATDVCPRALNFAEMNARLNGITNIELRNGSFFEPAGEELFEQVLSNPPFVISPETRYIHRDGGCGGDAVSELMARGAAARLEEGGYAVMLLNWHHATEDDWAQRPCQWTGGNGCDVRWLRFSDDDPLTYAASWLRQEEKGGVEAAGRRLEEWVRYYEEAGFRHLVSGAVIMRKRSGVQNWTRCEDIPIDISMTACGPQIERLFAAEDLLQGLRDERELLTLRLQVHPAHNVEQRLAIGAEGWALQSTTLHITSGMDYCAKVDLPTLQFLAGFDGVRTVREATQPVAEALGRTVEEVTPICVDMTKRFLRTGLLMLR